MRGMWYLGGIALLHAARGAEISCSEALGAGLCPDAFSLAEMGTCLEEKKSEVDDGCRLFIEVNQKCSNEIERCGSEVAWGSDAVLCASAWTNPADLTAECSEVVANIKKQAAPTKAPEESDEAKAKKAKRKAARRAAVNDVRKLNAEKSDPPTRKKKTKRTKNAKRSTDDILKQRDDLL